MMVSRRAGQCLAWALAVVISVAMSSGIGQAQMPHDSSMATHAQASQPAAVAPIRTTMAVLHAQGGVPRGWKFLMPPGDPAEGRKVFVAMECYACHQVKGEHFPQESRTSRGAGPDLTGMGAHHPAEYFAESILNPNRVIVQGPGYTGADGLSKMPSYADTMTLEQLTEVVAYLKSLTGGGMERDHHDTSDSMHSGGTMNMK